MTALETAELYFVPSGILATALGVASTEELKAGISFVGLVCGVLWLLSALDAYEELSERRVKLLTGLPIIASGAWLGSFCVHAGGLVL